MQTAFLTENIHDQVSKTVQHQRLLMKARCAADKTKRFHKPGHAPKITQLEPDHGQQIERGQSGCLVTLFHIDFRAQFALKDGFAIAHRAVAGQVQQVSGAASKPHADASTFGCFDFWQLEA